MDNTNFQTSFIPKKPLAEERAPVAAAPHASLFNFLGVVLFIASLVAGAGSYFYKLTLTKQLADMDASLAAARNSFEPSLITKLKLLDKRISSSKELLENHIVVTPIFDALQQSTLKSVQFTKFEYTTPDNLAAPIIVHMSGRARDYTAIALQSDELAKNKNIHNPIFSNLTLDERTGTVTFDLIFNVDSNLVRFTKNLDSFNVPKPQDTPAAATPSTNTVTSTPVDTSTNDATGGIMNTVTPKQTQ